MSGGYSLPMWTTGLTSAYPPAEALIAAVPQMRRRDCETFVRAWLTEGIPWVFRDAAALYEAFRRHIATRMAVDGHDVTLVGSARLGFSLRPAQLGRAYRDGGSDFDVATQMPDAGEFIPVPHPRSGGRG